MTNEEFTALTRDEMFEELKRVDPTRAKGKSRAKKSELQEFYAQATAAAPRVAEVSQEIPVLDSTDAAQPVEHYEGTGKAPPALRSAEELFVVEEARLEEPRPRIVTRRAAVKASLDSLDKDQITLLTKFRGTPRFNRRSRKAAESMLRKIRRFLPPGITLDEALAVL